MDPVEINFEEFLKFIAELKADETIDEVDWSMGVRYFAFYDDKIVVFINVFQTSKMNLFKRSKMRSVQCFQLHIFEKSLSDGIIIRIT